MQMIVDAQRLFEPGSDELFQKMRDSAPGHLLKVVMRKDTLSKRDFTEGFRNSSEMSTVAGASSAAQAIFNKMDMNSDKAGDDDRLFGNRIREGVRLFKSVFCK